MMKGLLAAPVGLILVGILCGGCSSTRKFDFKTAYKFSQYDYGKKSHAITESPALIASARPEAYQLSARQPLGLRETSGMPSKKPLGRAELKQARRELKQQIRSLNEEINLLEEQQQMASEEDKPAFESALVEKKIQRDAAKSMNHKIFLGILIGAAGLILLIVGVAEWLGALAVVVGLVLIVWGFIQKGTF